MRMQPITRPMCCVALLRHRVVRWIPGSMTPSSMTSCMDCSNCRCGIRWMVSTCRCMAQWLRRTTITPITLWSKEYATALALSFDLHANHDPCLSDLADIMVGYKTYPHVDMYETAERALDLLHRSLLGEIRPLSHVAITGVVLPSHEMATTAVPMHALETMANSMVKRRQALDVTPFGGFGYADTAQTSSSMTVCVDALQHPGFNAARQYAAMLAQKMVDALLARRTDFIPT